ncbi:MULTISPECIES: hypothetical protein [unclassified Deinococcus]|uniref:hypothetical protein n=1 Tax=unclassified Deinococcus TaxID=2623546 RepID=UPI001054A16F|nr:MULTISPECIES: hypothetical protein [unclassified Deinococcus]MBI0447172.1 hypothetical protein [Deinococcus sp. DB0503]TDE85661.1 hypothetical protein E0686_10945 [Deinococcus sp. S9]
MPKRSVPAASACLYLLGALTLSQAGAQTTQPNPIAANTTRAGTTITNTGYLDYLTDEAPDHPSRRRFPDRQ